MHPSSDSGKFQEVEHLRRILSAIVTLTRLWLLVAGYRLVDRIDRLR